MLSSLPSCPRNSITGMLFFRIVDNPGLPTKNIFVAWNVHPLLPFIPFRSYFSRCLVSNSITANGIQSREPDVFLYKRQLTTDNNERSNSRSRGYGKSIGLKLFTFQRKPLGKNYSGSRVILWIVDNRGWTMKNQLVQGHTIFVLVVITIHIALPSRFAAFSATRFSHLPATHAAHRPHFWQQADLWKDWIKYRETARISARQNP